MKPAKAVDTGSPKVEVPKGAPTPKLYSFNEDGAIVFDPKADLRQVLSQAVNDRVVSREHALAFMEAQGYKVKR